MKKDRVILLFILVIFLSSCENINNIEQELEYEKLYIVSGQISGGDENPEITFTKSLPLNTKFDIEKAEIKDVTAYIKTEDLRMYPLEYIKDGIYKPKYDLTIISGAKYELFALIDETRINGYTIAPSVPELVKARLIEGHIECEIIPQEDVVYSCVYVLIENYQVGNPQIALRESEFFSVEGPFDENSGSIIIRTGVIPQEYQTPSNQYRLGVEVYAWDKSYKKYFETKDNNKPIDDIFSQGGGSINWNITGENTIGLFIGFSTLVSMDIEGY
ncbi:MAG: hypothetical protein L3J41_10295 [Melioribacteraceae bacterium]|nr:hypothetical protein [Melioribacteraceae bacterium]